MTEPPAAGWTRRRLLSTVLVLAVLGGVIGSGTLAVFGRSDWVAANAVPTSTVGLGPGPTRVDVTFDPAAPGDRVIESVVVANDAGRAPLRYAVSSVASGPAGAGRGGGQRVVVKAEVTGTVPCAGFDSSGRVLYAGHLVPPSGALIGDPAPGVQTGDRTLAAGTSETLCFGVRPGTSVGDSDRAAAPAATLTFDAESTADDG